MRSISDAQIITTLIRYGTRVIPVNGILLILGQKLELKSKESGLQNFLWDGVFIEQLTYTEILHLLGGWNVNSSGRWHNLIFS